MGKVWIGTVVSFHGIKGEIRIKSSFPYKEKAFLIGSHLSIGEDVVEITSYRKHKDYDMLTFRGYTKIEEVEKFLNQKVFKDREELNLSEDEVLDEDLYQFKVWTSTGESGKIKEIFWASKENKILRVEISGREILVPYQKPFIQKIDPKNKEIVLQLISGM